MSLLLTSLTLHNFLSHADTHLEFKENEHLLLDGNSGDGKSSIIEAITWVLFGEGRVPNAKLIRNGETEGWVEIGIRDGGTEHVIKRGCTQGGKHTLELASTDDGGGQTLALSGVRDVQNVISNDIVRSSRTLFINSVAYLQGGEDSFVTQTASRRKEILLEIIDSIDFDAYHERTKGAIAARKGDRDVLEARLEGIRKEIDSDRRAAEGIEDVKNELYQVGLDEKKLASEVEEITKELSKLEKSLDEVRHLKNLKGSYLMQIDYLTEGRDRAERAGYELTELNGVELKASKLREELDRVKAALEREEEKKKVWEAQKAEELRFIESKPEVENHAEILEMLERRLKQGFEHTCPAGDECPHEASFSAQKAETEGKIKEIRARAVEQALELSNWESERKKLSVEPFSGDDLATLTGRARELESEIQMLGIRLAQRDRLVAEAKPFEEVSKKLIEAKAELEDTKKKIAAVDDFEVFQESQNLSAKRDAKRKTLDSLLGVKENLLGEFAKKQMYLDRIPVLEAEKKSINKRFKEIDAEVKKLLLLKDAFGSKGIKTIVVDHILPSLEDKVNEILSGMSHHTVSFETQIEKSSGDGNKEGLWIIIRDERGYEMDFESLSGGEKSKVTVAISEALATLQKCGWRMFDEFVTALDEDSLEQFMDAIGYLQRNYPQILIVSHIRGIKDAFENKVLVTKHNGVSTLKVI